MALFIYQGVNASGKREKGRINAATLEAALEVLSQKGIVPIDVQPIAKARAKPFSFLRTTLWMRPIRSEELITFCRQMYSLTKAGVPLLKTLTLILESTRSQILAKSLRGIIDDVTAGRTLTKSIQKHPKVFSPLFVSLIDAGENSGQLDVIFLQLSEYLELMDRTRKQIKTATRYPTFVITAIIAAMLIVNFFVIPNFAQVFSKFNLQLPLPTQILFATSNFFLAYWWGLLAGAVLLVVSVKIYLKTSKGQYLWDKYKLKVPVIGSIVYRILLGRFTRSFAMIMRTGVPLIQGIELVANISDNDYMKRNILTMRQGVERGETLTKTATNTGLFAPMVLQMFNTGEESGSLETLLQEAAEFYEREVEYDLRRLSDLIEPFLLSFLGIMVLVLALGIFLPMWDMINLVQR